MFNTQRSPLAPLKKGENRFEVPLFKGDLGGSCALLLTVGLFKHPLSLKRMFEQVWSVLLHSQNLPGDTLLVSRSGLKSLSVYY
jgi:hypothetical protein